MKRRGVLRALRALLQAGGATAIVAIIAVFVTLDGPQAAALTAGLTIVLGFVQNAIEDSTGVDILVPRE